MSKFRLDDLDWIVVVISLAAVMVVTILVIELRSERTKRVELEAEIARRDSIYNDRLFGGDSIGVSHNSGQFITIPIRRDSSEVVSCLYPTEYEVCRMRGHDYGRWNVYVPDEITCKWCWTSPAVLSPTKEIIDD